MEQEHLNMFLVESNEHLQALNDDVLKLENNPEDIPVIGEIFRSAHSLKSMAATMGFVDISDLTHEVESVFDLLRNKKLNVSSDVIDLVFECIDKLEKMVEDIQNGGLGALDVSTTVKKLKSLYETKDTESSNEGESVGGSLSNQNVSHFVTVKFNDSCVLKSVRAIMVIDALKSVGEVIDTIPSNKQLENDDFDGVIFKVSIFSNGSNEDIYNVISKVSEIESIKVDNPEVKNALTINSVSEIVQNNNKNNSTPQKSNQTMRVDVNKIEHLMNMFEETVIERGRIEEIAEQLNHPELNERLQKLSKVSKELQNIVLNMRMVPVENIFNRFPRMVRSLSSDLGKKVKLIINCDNAELDRAVIDEIGDPLVHLIRNSVDHGIETKEKRTKVGKNPAGTLLLEAFHSGNNVIIQVTDDGAGINKEKVIAKAINNGLTTEVDAQKLSDEEVYDLLFHPGFSTAENISDISGRGVGLDVVKTTIEKLGGTLNVESSEGKGSRFTIKLPLTLSIIQSMLVEVKGSKYAFQLANIIESIRINRNEIHEFQGKSVIDFRGKTIQIISLNEIFYKEQMPIGKNGMIRAIIVKNAERTFAVVCDKIIGQKEIVLKNLGEFFKDSNNYFSGATILGDGKVVLIIDIDKL